jgi:hypothetical protein
MGERSKGRCMSTAPVLASRLPSVEHEPSTVTPPESPAGSDDVTTRSELGAVLKRATTAAYNEGLQIEGAYNVRSSDPDVPDYTIEISGLRKRASGEGE